MVAAARQTRASDAELLHQARGGDDDAYFELWGRHDAFAHRVAAGLARNGHDREDLVATARDRIRRALANGKGPSVAFRAYLCTSLRHVALDHYRGAATPTEDVDLLRGGEAAPGPAVESDVVVREAFARLSERHREVLALAEVEQLSPAEVGAHLGLSANAASQLAHRARRALRYAWIDAHMEVGEHQTSTCRRVCHLLRRLVAGDATDQERTVVDDHLASCADCRGASRSAFDSGLGRSAVCLFLLGPHAASWLFPAPDRWRPRRPDRQVGSERAASSGGSIAGSAGRVGRAPVVAGVAGAVIVLGLVASTLVGGGPPGTEGRQVAGPVEVDGDPRANGGPPAPVAPDGGTSGVDARTPEDGAGAGAPSGAASGASGAGGADPSPGRRSAPAPSPAPAPAPAPAPTPIAPRSPGSTVPGPAGPAPGPSSGPQTTSFGAPTRTDPPVVIPPPVVPIPAGAGSFARVQTLAGRLGVASAAVEVASPSPPCPLPWAVAAVLHADVPATAGSSRQLLSWTGFGTPVTTVQVNGVPTAAAAVDVVSTAAGDRWQAAAEVPRAAGDRYAVMGMGTSPVACGSEAPAVGVDLLAVYADPGLPERVVSIASGLVAVGAGNPAPAVMVPSGTGRAHTLVTATLDGSPLAGDGEEVRWGTQVVAGGGVHDGGASVGGYDVRRWGLDGSPAATAAILSGSDLVLATRVVVIADR